MQIEEIERPVTDVAVKQAAPINQDLITLDPKRYVAEVYKPHHSTLAKLIAEASTVVIDCTTTAGYAIAVKWRALFRDEVRGATEATRVERKAPILMIGRLIDSESQAIQSEAKLHEDRFDAAIKAEAARKEAIKAAEKVRVDTIKARIQSIRDLPMMAVGRDSAMIKRILLELQAQPADDSFAEMASVASAAWDAADRALNAALEVAQHHEAAETQRLADIATADKQRANEAAENARVAAENERVANELAIAARKLAEQQAAIELLDKQRADQAAANLKAEADARAEADRKAKAERDLAAAEAQAKLDAITAQIAEAQKKRDDERDADDKRKADAAAQEKADAVRDEATEMDLQFDMNANAVRALAACAPPAIADDLPSTLGGFVMLQALSDRNAIADAADQVTASNLYPTDAELVGEICALFASEWSMDKQQAAARMAKFDFAAALAGLGVVA